MSASQEDMIQKLVTANVHLVKMLDAARVEIEKRDRLIQIKDKEMRTAQLEMEAVTQKSFSNKPPKMFAESLYCSEVLESASAYDLEFPRLQGKYSPPHVKKR